jgi:xanthine dehydrogenase accessory factor
LDVFVEAIMPQPAAFIFGAGHISKSLARVAGMAGFRTVIVDDRDQFANRDRFPDADEIHAGEYEEIFPKLEVNHSSYIIIVTRGHRDDMRVLEWAVRTDARYVAMIGSKRKVISVVKELQKTGIPAEAFERIHAPMGLDIGAITPEEIAVSVVAEMIAVRRNPSSDYKLLSKSIYANERLRAHAT